MEARIKERVDKITKSPLDTRDYTFIQLQNDMKVLLICDKDTDKAAAALSVNVGKSYHVLSMVLQCVYVDAHARIFSYQD